MKIIVLLIAILLVSWSATGGIKRALEGNYVTPTYKVRGRSSHPLEYYRPRSTHYPVYKSLKETKIEKANVEDKTEVAVGRSISFPGTPVSSTNKVSKSTVASVLEGANKKSVQLLDPNHAFQNKFGDLTV